MEGIFGRDLELAAIDRFLDSVVTSPAVLVIEGEAGTGKTTLSARRCPARGRTWSADFACTAGRERAEAVRRRPCRSRHRGIRRGRICAPACPTRALTGALFRDDPDEGASARTTATAFVGVLGACAAKGGVLPAVDDVQWLDLASAQTLAFAFRRLPTRVCVVLAHGRQAGRERPLGLSRSAARDRVQRMALPPLSLAVLHYLVKFRLGRSLPRPLLLQLAEASGGNPFYALEIARALGSESTATPAGRLRVPHNLEELVASRVETLSAPARHLALVVAATSQPTQSILVSALTPDADVSAALVEAEEAGVLSSEDNRIRFQHPLLASVIYSSASAERRRQVHRRLAFLVADPEERARHLALATTEPDEEVATELAAAAAAAAKRGASAAAAELYAAARRVTPMTDQEQLLSRNLGAAKALLAAGDVGGARECANEAATAGAASVRAEAELLLGDIDWLDGSWVHAVQHLEEALAAQPADPALAARVYPKLVNYTVGNAPGEGIKRAKRALAALDGERAPAAVAHVAFDWYWAELLLGHGAQP